MVAVRRPRHPRSKDTRYNKRNQPQEYPTQCRTEGGGGHGPRAQALEGAPAQLVGANFKSGGEFQPSKSSIYAMGPALPMH